MFASEARTSPAPRGAHAAPLRGMSPTSSRAPQARGKPGSERPVARRPSAQCRLGTGRIGTVPPRRRAGKIGPCARWAPTHLGFADDTASGARLPRRVTCGSPARCEGEVDGRTSMRESLRRRAAPSAGVTGSADSLGPSTFNDGADAGQRSHHRRSPADASRKFIGARPRSARHAQFREGSVQMATPKVPSTSREAPGRRSPERSCLASVVPRPPPTSGEPTYADPVSPIEQSTTRRVFR